MSRVALLCHSTNPRGGVVHALELAEALESLGHEATVLAPDATGLGFFRATACATAPVAATRLTGTADTLALVEARVGDYLRHFADPAHRRYDVFHAQDGISGNALATLAERGLIDGFVRTVHHVDTFADPLVAALQDRSIVAAEAHCVVSALWRDALAARYGLAATLVGNGVDRARFSPQPRPGDLGLRRRLGIEAGPVFLAIGGVEARKNTVRLLEAFAQVHALLPGAQLVIAGGSSLLDHGAAQARFADVLAASGLPGHAVLRLGPVADDDMPALYRNADALMFPSLVEGFGLVVLEAMASGLPVVTSRIAPFTEYLAADDVLWCDPEQVSSIAGAMMLSSDTKVRAALRSRGGAVATRHGWDSVARAHLALYATLGAAAYA